MGDGDPLAELKAVICAYMVGSIPMVEFVAHLDRHDIPMTQELQRLLRQQQCDNRATFRDYVKAVFPHRTDVGESAEPGMLAYLAGVQQREVPRGEELEQDFEKSADEIHLAEKHHVIVAREDGESESVSDFASVGKLSHSGTRGADHFLNE